MKLQIKRDFRVVYVLLIFFTLSIPIISLFRDEISTMALLLATFVLVTLIMSDEKYHMDKFFFSLPVRISHFFHGRTILVILIGSLWIILETMTIYFVNNFPFIDVFIAIIVQISTLIIIIPLILVFLKLIKYKVVRWFPVIFIYLISVMAALLITDIMQFLITDSGAGTFIGFLILFSIPLLSVLIYVFTAYVYRYFQQRLDIV